MASEAPKQRNSLYPQVIDSNHEAPSHFHEPNRSSPNLYPSLDTNDLDDLVQTLFPQHYATTTENATNSPRSAPSAPPAAHEEVLIRIPGAILNLIDKEYSVELASGDFSIIRLRQGDSAVAVYARVSDEIQWPLAKDETAVKVDDSHYFFSFRAPSGSDSDSDEEDHRRKVETGSDLLSYGLTIASKGQEGKLKELDSVLQNCSNFSVQKVSESAKKKGEVLDGSLAKETSPKDLDSKKKKELLEERSAAYWTTLAPNVEDYSGTAARMIAAGSGHVIKGILWCGDVTVERLKWGNEVMKRKMSPGAQAQISPDTLKRIRRVKRVTKMTEKVAHGFLSGVLKVSGFFTSKLANSKAGKKFFSLVPGEVVLASLDGFSKVCDAVEVAGKNVLSTSSTVTTEFVNHRYGEQAAEATSEGLSAAGHAFSAAWAAFKVRKALNPKSALKPSSLAKASAKAVASEYKAKKSK